MSCRRVEGLLGNYQDGLLGLAGRRVVEDHLAECGSCMALKSEMDLALGFLRQAPAVDVPADLVSDILNETVRAEPPAVGLVVAGVGPLGWIRPLLQPLIEPRFAMSLAMALVSFSILTWSGQKTLDRWQDADPMVHVMTATADLDQAWQRGVEVYRRVFGSAQASGTSAQPVSAVDAEDTVDPARTQ
jgi:hypothetical protein